VLAHPTRRRAAGTPVADHDRGDRRRRHHPCRPRDRHHAQATPQSKEVVM